MINHFMMQKNQIKDDYQAFRKYINIMYQINYDMIIKTYGVIFFSFLVDDILINVIILYMVL